MSDEKLGGIGPGEHALTNWQSAARALKAQIESLQRELAEKHDEVLALEAAAITPEMRESIEKWLEETAPPNPIDYVAAALSARVMFHDLLNTGGEG